MTRWIYLALLCFSPALFASQFQWIGKPKTETVSGLSIDIYPEVEVTEPDGSVTHLKLSGSGIRKSSVVFVQVNVYYIASYVIFPELVNLPDAMAGIKLSPTRLLYITALRPLTGTDVRTTMEQALEYNGVDLTTPVFEKLMNQVEGLNVKPGDRFAFGATPGENEQRIFFELPDKTFEAEGADISVDFWRIWFGKPFDAGLKDLQPHLVGKKPFSTH